ncbi:hypothetical protein ABW20_dc0105928 [Dactylellina cionopaga]|nr:hypothetical protein ABW20_dc0105928 [Dactylellina cionopaga]
MKPYTKILFLFTTFHATTTLALGRTACPKNLAELPDYDAIPIGQETPFTGRFAAYAKALSSTPWFTSFAKDLHSKVVALEEVVVSNERDNGGSIIPYPEETLNALIEFITERKLQCYAWKSPEQLLLAMVWIAPNTGYGGMSDIGLGRSRDSIILEAHDPAEEDSGVSEEQQDPQTADTSLNLPQEIEEELNPAVYFQFMNTDVLHLFSALVDAYVFQLHQLKSVAEGKYTKHEMTLLNDVLVWWNLVARESLTRAVRLVQHANGYLRAPGPYDEEKAAPFLDKEVQVWEEKEQFPALGVHFS